MVIQPMFSRSDRKFTGKETILSGSVASDRSGNERAVNRAKLSNVLKCLIAGRVHVRKVQRSRVQVLRVGSNGPCRTTTGSNRIAQFHRFR